MKKRVTIIYLEMLRRCHLRRKAAPAGMKVQVVKVREPSPTLNQYFFRTVGLPWRWYSRLDWTYQDWQQYLERPGVHTYMGLADGTPFGYYELEEHPDQGSVQIVFFGLLDEFTGRGLGGYLLSRAASHGWDLGAGRVWLHTCTIDHPNALANYQARGFTEYKRETVTETLPNLKDPAWLTPRFVESYRRLCKD